MRRNKDLYYYNTKCATIYRKRTSWQLLECYRHTLEPQDTSKLPATETYGSRWPISEILWDICKNSQGNCRRLQHVRKIYERYTQDIKRIRRRLVDVRCNSIATKTCNYFTRHSEAFPSTSRQSSQSTPWHSQNVLNSRGDSQNTIDTSKRSQALPST